MARCPTYQDFEDSSRDKQNGFQPDRNNPANQNLFQRISHSVFGNHARKLEIIDGIVNNSQEGSLSNEEARRQAEKLFSMRGRMTPDEFYAAQELLDVHFQNNLEYGLANSFYDEWTRDLRRNG